MHRVGYEFQYFTSLDYRRKGVARRLHQHIEDYLTRQGVLLSYCLIMEGNLSSIVRNFYTLQISLIFYQHG
ncbi:MAG: GNAT family N-acetyltransferase [Candidatus Methanofastidiosia archaeon]